MLVSHWKAVFFKHLILIIECLWFLLAGARDQGPGDQGPGTILQGPKTRNQRPVTRDQGPGTKGQRPGAFPRSSPQELSLGASFQKLSPRSSPQKLSHKILPSENAAGARFFPVTEILKQPSGTPR